MAAKLNQIIAVENGTKNRVKEKLEIAYKTIQKPDLFTGHHKTFVPRDEDPNAAYGEKQPDNVKNVQADVKKILDVIREAQTELFDIALVKDATNCMAKADLVVDGVVLFKDVPVTFLVWFEKRLDELHSEVKKLPVHEASDKWTWDPSVNMYATSPIEQTSTKKVNVPLVLYAATKEHPAQVKEVTEDIRVGMWKTTKFSAALPVDKKELYLSRVEKLQKATKQAREAANMAEVVTTESLGKKIFDFVLA